MLFAAGLPVFFLEIAVGQYAGVGPIKLFGRLAPALRGVGFVSKTFFKLKFLSINHKTIFISFSYNYHLYIIIF